MRAIVYWVYLEHGIRLGRRQSMDTSQNQLSFEQIADAFMHLRKQGKGLSIEKLAEAIPEYRDEILERLPIMVLLESNLGTNEESLLDIGVNTLIDGCRIEAKIGRGASATVFRAHQDDFDRKVAIKVLSKQKIRWKLRFQVERRAMAKLEHPNIVQPYAFHEDDQHYCLIMKFVDGCSLQELIDKTGKYQNHQESKRLLSDWGLFASMAADAADAIAHAHSNGIIHRDLKPSNLLIDKNLKIWVTDFGLTKMINEDLSLSRTGDVVGTPRFMAPEQFQGICDERSDVYSLGLALLAVVAGCSNIRNGGADVDTGWRTSDIKKLNPEIPEQLVRILLKACELNPVDRFQSAGEMKIVLRRFLAGGIAERRSRNRGRRTFYTRRLPQKLAAVALASLVLVGIYFTVQGDSDASQPSAAALPDVGAYQDQERMRISVGSVLNDVIDEKPGQLDALYRGFMQHHVDDLATTMNLSLDEKNGIQQQVNEMFNDKAYKESVAKARESLNKAGYIQTMRLMRLIQLLERSSMSEQEKDDGRDLIRRMAYLVSEKIVSQDEANDFEKSLTYGRLMNAEELDKNSFSDLRLREWLRGLESRVNAEPQAKEFDVRKGEFLNALRGMKVDKQ